MSGHRRLVLQLVEWADGTAHAHAGRYLEDSDVETVFTDQQWMRLTTDRGQAKTFTDVLSALLYLRRSPVNQPLRDDGLPNRPLTAYTWECLEVPS